MAVLFELLIDAASPDGMIVLCRVCCFASFAARLIRQQFRCGLSVLDALPTALLPMSASKAERTRTPCLTCLAGDRSNLISACRGGLAGCSLGYAPTYSPPPPCGRASSTQGPGRISSAEFCEVEHKAMLLMQLGGRSGGGEDLVDRQPSIQVHPQTSRTRACQASADVAAMLAGEDESS